MITDKRLLASDLKKVIQVNIPALVSIDGIDGSGKTTLAEYLSQSTNCEVVHLDEYADENRDEYVALIRASELKKTIIEAKQRSCCILVEGVCVLQILERIGLHPDFKIYIKKLKWDHYWVDSEIYEEAKTFADKLALEEMRTRQFAEFEGQAVPEAEITISGLKRDIITYHWTYRPDEKADFVFGNQIQ